MRKKAGKRIRLIVLLCAALMVGGAFFIHNVVKADSNDFYLYYINTSDSSSIKISEYTVDKSSMVIHLGNDVSGIMSNDIITWHVEDENILTVEPYLGSPTSATITCKRPGKSKVWATIERPQENGTYEVFNTECIFTVRLAINDYVNTPNNQDKIVHLFDEDPDDCGSLIIDVDETFDFKLKIGAAHAEDLSWTSLNKNIATINEAGTVTGIQPGIAKILVQTYEVDHQDNILQSDYIYVIVRPKFKDESGRVGNTVTISNPTTLETNISDYVSTDENIEVRNASQFAWIVKDSNTNEILVNTYTNKTSPLVKVTPSRVDGSVDIDCVAGKYIVEVYPIYTRDESINVMKAENYMPSKANVTEYVDIKLLTDYDQVQVNDVWDLYQVSNIYNIANDFDINVLNCDYSKQKGTVTFTTQGLAMIQFKRRQGSILPLDGSFTSDVLTLYVNVKPYTAQNMEVSIKKGATKKISVTDFGYDPSQYGVEYNYEFISNDKKIATIESNTPKTAEVYGVKEGTTTVDCKISYNNGISRKLTWNIKVWKVISATIDITEKQIEIGDQFNITARYPSDVNPDSDINVKWINASIDGSNSAIEIVNNENTDYRGVSIRGIKEGKATICLRDMNTGDDLAYCYVTVVAKTKISFPKSDYDVVLDKKDSSKNIFTLDPVFAPTKPVSPNVTWESSDKSVAEVTPNTGVVTYKKAGYAYIKAIYHKSEDLEVEASYRLNVYQKYEKIVLNKTSVTANVGDDILLSATCTPDKYVLAEDQVLSWSAINSVDGPIVTISGNTGIPTIKAVAPGKTTITVKTTSGEMATCTVTVKQMPTGVKFPDKTITMNVGDKKQLTAVLTPLNVTDSNVTFTSSNTDFLTIDKNGIATAVYGGPNGKVTVYVDVVTANGIRATMGVTIVQHVTEMTLNYQKKTIAKATTFTLKPTIIPANSYDKGVTYKSSDSKIATVTSAGVVRGIKGGSALISCTSNDTGLTVYCLVVVTERVTSVSLNKTSYVIGVGKTYTLKATVKSNFATNTAVKWSTSNKSIVTVTSKGVIKGIKTGYATITVAAQDGSGETASCRVRVIRQVTKVKLNKASAQILEGNSLKLKATITPSNATTKSVKWTSSDEEVAYVDSAGKVIAVKVGRCKITATARDGSGKSASCIVQVIKETPITGLTIVNKNITMAVGEKETLKSFVAPKKTTDSVRWYSDDSRIATVNSKTGKITAKRTGTATVTLASSSGKSTTTTITVVGLNRTSLTMEQYDTYQLRVINGKGVQWVSSNQRVVNVSASGKLSARKVGTSYVSAIVNGRKIRCKVVVRKIR